MTDGAEAHKQKHRPEIDDNTKFYANRVRVYPKSVHGPVRTAKYVILIACLFWGFLWGLVGLILAMPITACIKLVCQNVPELHRWADLMSRDWQPPAFVKSGAKSEPSVFSTRD